MIRASFNLKQKENFNFTIKTSSFYGGGNKIYFFMDIFLVKIEIKIT